MSQNIKTFNFLVEGGKATAGPPIGPALGPLGLNVMQVVKKINELTQEYAGMRVPVKVIVDTERKTFEVEVGTPTTAALIVKELKIEKGARQSTKEWVGNLTVEQVIKIAKIKMKDMGVKTLKAAVKTVAGTCQSMGVTIDGKPPKQFIQDVEEGLYDGIISKHEGEAS
ncbi:50S ribosomal protein L11 [Infirmifilum lucidum]|uniref:Large ribosomal subunit protein uL11 n=1 Tax=Infirmifilum lucidum TaxID=2776706 RepID=A0A7L9FF22_9CREN|nr:50S ribosomal protein L11 [Infirmifilum lucidum]QOJ78398.1 50S ribosomal protein L11 [Infirmifilum lucidum]